MTNWFIGSLKYNEVMAAAAATYSGAWASVPEFQLRPGTLVYNTIMTDNGNRPLPHVGTKEWRARLTELDGGGVAPTMSVPATLTVQDGDPTVDLAVYTTGTGPISYGATGPGVVSVIGSIVTFTTSAGDYATDFTATNAYGADADSSTVTVESAGAWTPDDLPGIALWADFNDAASRTTDGSNGIGDNLTGISDRSSAGNNMVQGYAANPGEVTIIANPGAGTATEAVGCGVVPSSSMFVTLANLNVPQPYYVAFVGNLTSGANRCYVDGSGPSIAERNRHRKVGASGRGIETGTTSGTFTGLTGSGFAINVFEANGAASRGNINARPDQGVTVNTDPGSASILHTLGINGLKGGGEGSVGSVGEVIIWGGSAYDQADWDEVINYLTAKWIA